MHLASLTPTGAPSLHHRVVRTQRRLLDRYPYRARYCEAETVATLECLQAMPCVLDL